MKSKPWKATERVRHLAVDEALKARCLAEHRAELKEAQTATRHAKRPLKTETLPTRYEKGFLDKLDARTEIARGLRSSFDEIVNDLGGLDSLSHVRKALAERFVWCEAIMRGIERKFVEQNGDDAESSGKLLARWIQAVNGLTGLARTLGLERKARKLDLRSYVEGKRT